MSIGATTTDIQGGGYPMAFAGGYPAGGGFGFGSGGIIEGLLLGTLLRGGGPFGNNWGGGFGGPGFGGPFGGLPANVGAGTVVAEQNVSDLRKDVADVKTAVMQSQCDTQSDLQAQTIGQTQEFRNLDNRLCESEKSALTTGYQLSLQGFQNTQQITNLITAFQSQNAEQFCQIKEAVHSDGDATRALINQIETQNLRDALAAERRNRDNREIEINVTQTNQQTQNQLQAQLQQQQQVLTGFLHNLATEIQLQRQGNRVVQFGTGNVSTPTNTANQVGG